MNDDILISRIDPVPEADAASLVSERAAQELAQQIMRTDPGVRRGGTMRLRPRWVALPAVAATVAGAAAAVVVIAGSGQPSAVHGISTRPTSGVGDLAVTSPMELAANATAAAGHSAEPGSAQWVYLKVVSTISDAPQGGLMAQKPGTRHITETWIQVDGQKSAVVQNGRIIVSDILGSPEGWPRISYGYLNSLPTDPTRLMQVIRHNIQTLPTAGATAADAQVFDSVAALIENNPGLPARLSAALYGVLAQLKSVRLAQATDPAGQKVLSLYQIENGYLEREIFINPVTYSYAGQRVVAIRSHTSPGLDGTASVRGGELLADDAIITSKIVDHPGEK